MTWEKNPLQCLKISPKSLGFSLKKEKTKELKHFMEHFSKGQKHVLLCFCTFVPFVKFSANTADLSRIFNQAKRYPD